MGVRYIQDINDLKPIKVQGGMVESKHILKIQARTGT